MERGCVKYSTPTKLIESASMTYEESEETHNQISKLWNQVKELDDMIVKHVDI
jgi:hypothetical protein